MDEVKTDIKENGKGDFSISADGKRLGEMVVSVYSNHLTVYHTEVLPEAEGRGLAKKLLESMVGYARSHQLKVIPLCLFVQAQFKRHPEEYADLFEKEK